MITRDRATAVSALLSGDRATAVSAVLFGGRAAGEVLDRPRRRAIRGGAAGVPLALHDRQGVASAANASAAAPAGLRGSPSRSARLTAQRPARLASMAVPAAPRPTAAWLIGYSIRMSGDPASAVFAAIAGTVIAFPLSMVCIVVALVALAASNYVFARAEPREHARCQSCGYDLYGSVSSRCPECGCATKSLGKEECEVGP